ncbi:MAG: oxygen-independent coproporphyrinogen III oxidase [Hyphomicrobiaceae bacterium]|nr:oxygen-independent coproporphyrinogen III oxidase [Hyphomicrobiaceae bacterium]
MDPALVNRLSRPLPRYTSYPTTPHFRDDVGAETHASWVEDMPSSSRVSLYIHIPFCDTLCWFCACTTKITRRYEPIANYLRQMTAEIDRVSDLLPDGPQVDHIHWGGGSPDILAPEDISSLSALLRNRFAVADDAEFAIEVDPREVTNEKIDALVAAGLTRISLGVQDFDPAVQKAINRHQSIEKTRDVVDRFRAAGIASVNIDLVYGLPYQTTDTAGRTIEAVIALDPNRVAIFGYAHLPQRVTHQRLINNDSVPGIEERLVLSRIMSDNLTDAGYVRTGIDHFCKPDDTMAAGPLRRNFQGYTTDLSDALLGFGASAISRLPQGYVQNTIPIADYQRRIEQTGLGTVRGIMLSPQDKARAFAIEKLMCELRFPAHELCQRFGRAGACVADEGERLTDFRQNGLVEPTADGFIVTEKGRPFLRAIAAEFDAYLSLGSTTHSTGI